MLDDDPDADAEPLAFALALPPEDILVETCELPFEVTTVTFVLNDVDALTQTLVLIETDESFCFFFADAVPATKRAVVSAIAQIMDVLFLI